MGRQAVGLRARRCWPLLAAGLGIGFVALLCFSPAFRPGRERGANASAPPPHDPEISRRHPSARNESVTGDSYVNLDLGLSLRKPSSWEMSLGRREESAGRPYEGLLVKVEEKSEARDVPPTVSLTRRMLKAGQTSDPVAYLRESILGDGRKSVREGPDATTLRGFPAAKAWFDVGTLEVLQYIVVRRREVFALTAMAPRGSLASMRADFDSIVDSLNLE